MTGKKDNFEINRIMQTINGAYLNNAVNLLVAFIYTGWRRAD